MTQGADSPEAKGDLSAQTLCLITSPLCHVGSEILSLTSGLKARRAYANVVHVTIFRLSRAHQHIYTQAYE